MKSKVSQIWERISLRTKLTILSVSVIATLLVVSSLGTISFLRSYLRENLDEQLAAASVTLMREDPDLIEYRLASNELKLPSLPNSFYIAYLDPSGEIIIALTSSSGWELDAVPNLSNFSLEAVIHTGATPIEVNREGRISDDAGIGGWRMVAVPLTTTLGSLVVAFPTGSDRALLTQYTIISGGFGLFLLILSGFIIRLTIKSALKPLNEVERAAEAVAKGDISKRLIEREGNTEIARLNHSLNTMLDGVENAMSARSKTLAQMRRFVSDASHELRTPLASVRGYAELYRMGALKKSAQVDEAMARIESEAVRMTGLVESLLTLTRLDEATKLDLKKTNLITLALDSAKDSSVAHRNQKIVVTDLTGNKFSNNETIDAKVDANAMRQVLTNLLSNACRFSPTGAQIEIALDNNTKINGKRQLIIEVRDHGEGIPKQLREKVFERFFRVDNSRNSETGGSGLGLSIVSTIVARHSGKIRATETPGGGATFRIEIPA